MIRIGVCSDGHYGTNGDSGVTYQDRHNQMVAWLNSENEKKPLDFVVYNGDLVNNLPGLMGDVKTILNNLDVPYHVGYGNHDVMSFANWKALWGTDVDYHFEVKNVGFVILNSGEPDYADVGYYYGYRLPDFNFLKNSCDYYTNQGKDVVVFCHIRFDHTQYGGNSNGSFGVDIQPHHNYVKNNPRVRLVIHSHGHGSSFVRNFDNQYYAWSGHFSHRFTTALNYFGYRIIEISDDGVIKSYFVNGTNNVIDHSIISEELFDLNVTNQNVLNKTIKKNSVFKDVILRQKKKLF